MAREASDTIEVILHRHSRLRYAAFDPTQATTGPLLGQCSSGLCGIAWLLIATAHYSPDEWERSECERSHEHDTRNECGQLPVHRVHTNP